MTCDEIQQFLDAYVTCSLDVKQVAQVRAHIAECPECRHALNDAKVAINLISGSLIPMEPPPRVKQKLMAAVGRDRASASLPLSRPKILGYAMAACVGLVIGGVSVYFAFANRIPPALPDRTQLLQAALAERDSHIEQLNRLIGASNLNLVELAGQKSSAHGHILYDPTNHNWRIYVFDLDPPPLNHVYELWAITTDNKKLRAGTFTVDAQGFATYSGKVPGNVAAAAITDEPAPGTDTPTGTIHLLGKISS